MYNVYSQNIYKDVVTKTIKGTTHSLSCTPSLCHSEMGHGYIYIRHFRCIKTVKM